MCNIVLKFVEMDVGSRMSAMTVIQEVMMDAQMNAKYNKDTHAKAPQQPNQAFAQNHPKTKQ